MFRAPDREGEGEDDQTEIKIEKYQSCRIYPFKIL
jgi:hypothetical protein